MSFSSEELDFDHYIDVGQVLGGKATFRTTLPSSASEWSEKIVNTGFPFNAAESFVVTVGKTASDVVNVLGVDRKTVYRRKRKGFLTPDESNSLYEYAKIFSEAANVLGSVRKARHWINSPIKALGNKAPLEAMKTAPGADEVVAILMRIEYGGYS